MAWAVRFGGGVEYASFTKVNRNDAKWRIEFRVANPETSSNVIKRVMGQTSSLNDNISYRWSNTSDAIRYRLDGVDTETAFYPTVTIDQDFHTYIIKDDGVDMHMQIDEGAVNTIVGGGDKPFKDFNAIARAAGIEYELDFEYFRYYNTSTAEEKIHDWDATNSDHTSLVLNDFGTASNHATLQNMSTAAWVDLGGDQTETHNFSATINTTPQANALKTKIINYLAELSQEITINSAHNKKNNSNAAIQQNIQQQALSSKKTLLHDQLSQSYELQAEKAKKINVSGEVQQNYELLAYFYGGTIEVHQFRATISVTPLNSASLIKKNEYQKEIINPVYLSGKAIKTTALQVGYLQQSALAGNAFKYTNINAELTQTIVNSGYFFNAAQPIHLRQFRINGEIVFQRFNGATVKQRFNGVLC